MLTTEITVSEPVCSKATPIDCSGRGRSASFQLNSSDGVGFQIQVYFQLFDVTGILAYTLAFIIVVQLIEWLLLQPLPQRLQRLNH